MTLYWACAQTLPHGETLAIRNLHRQNFTAFYPFFLTKNRYRHMITQPVFPSYVFIQLDSDIINWPPINSTSGISRLLTRMGNSGEEYKQPAVIPSGFVETLQKIRVEQGERAGDLIPVGAVVKITKGPFAERVALVTLSAADRVRLLIQAFNRQLAVDFAVDAVTVFKPS